MQGRASADAAVEAPLVPRRVFVGGMPFSMEVCICPSAVVRTFVHSCRSPHNCRRYAPLLACAEQLALDEI